MKKKWYHPMSWFKKTPTFEADVHKEDPPLCIGDLIGQTIEKELAEPNEVQYCDPEPPICEEIVESMGRHSHN